VETFEEINAMCLQRCWPVLVAGVGLGWVGALAAGGAAGQGKPAAGEAGSPAQLVTRLGSQRFRDREDASRALDELGAKALPPLRQAAADPDPEVRRRAAALVGRIEKRLETERLLEPQHVRLRFKDVAVTEAVTEFNRRTGWDLQIQGDRSGLIDRKITLDTGDVPLWDAFDQFCRKAGLNEPRPAPVREQAADANTQEELMMQRRIAVRRAIMVQRMGYAQQSGVVENHRRIGVVAGRYDPLPTSRAGAVRVRAMPPRTGIEGQAKGDGEYVFALEVLPEPRLHWHGVVQVRVDRAVDEHGQVLRQASTAEDSTANLYGANTVVFIDGNDMNGTASGQHTAVRLKQGEQPSKRLRELQGRITARVQTPPQPLMTVDNVLKAAGRTVHGSNGGSIKVLDVSRQPGGEVKLHVQIASGTGMGIWMNRGVRRRVVWAAGGRRMIVTEDTSDQAAPTLALQDAKGRAFVMEQPRPLNFMRNFPAGEVVEEMDLVFHPRSGQGPPAKFVYSGPRTVAIDIPFKLKDVALP
jgi:hypothetical protein